MTSPIARFRHPCDDGTGAMPYAIAGVGRSVGLSGSWGHYVQVLGWSPTGHLRTVQRRVDWSDVQQCRHRRVAHCWWKLLEQGPKSQATSTNCSGGVSPSLAPPISMDSLSSAARTRQSALTLIAFLVPSIRFWRQRVCFRTLPEERTSVWRCRALVEVVMRSTAW